MLNVTLVILVITVIVSIMAFNNRELLSKLLFNAFQIAQRKEYWRLITNGFIHGSWAHLGVNMFVLYMFGGAVEEIFAFHFGSKGTFYFITLYIGSLFASSIPALRKHANNPGYNSLGASGAVSAVLFSFIVMQPTSMLGVMLVIPMPAFLFGILYLWYENYMGKREGGRIAHDAHYAGAIFGLLFTIFIRPSFAIEFVQQVTGYLSSFFG